MTKNHKQLPNSTTTDLALSGPMTPIYNSRYGIHIIIPLGTSERTIYVETVYMWKPEIWGGIYVSVIKEGLFQFIKFYSTTMICTNKIICCFILHFCVTSCWPILKLITMIACITAAHNVWTILNCLTTENVHALWWKQACQETVVGD